MKTSRDVIEELKLHLRKAVRGVYAGTSGTGKPAGIKATYAACQAAGGSKRLPQSRNQRLLNYMWMKRLIGKCFSILFKYRLKEKGCQGNSPRRQSGVMGRACRYTCGMLAKMETGARMPRMNLKNRAYIPVCSSNFFCRRLGVECGLF
jgi:hypothetical protein